MLSGTDGTQIHRTHQFNDLGVGSVDGSAFVEAARQQADDVGVNRRQSAAVTDVSADSDRFDLSTDGDVVNLNVTIETSVDGAHVTGAMVRGEEWQAVISAGDGAAAALNVLTREKDDRYHDFDTPATVGEVVGDLRDEEA